MPGHQMFLMLFFYWSGSFADRAAQLKVLRLQAVHRFSMVEGGAAVNSSDQDVSQVVQGSPSASLGTDSAVTRPRYREVFSSMCLAVFHRRSSRSF